MDLLGTRFGLLTVVWMSCFLVQIRCVLANEMWPFVDEMRPCVGEVAVSG